MVWRKPSSYSCAITTSPVYIHMYGSTSPRAIYVHAASHQGISSTASLLLSQFPTAHGRAYLAILLLISQSLMGTIRFSYSSIGSRRCVTSYHATRQPRLQSSPSCSLITLLDFTGFQIRLSRIVDPSLRHSFGPRCPNSSTLESACQLPFTHRLTVRLKE